MEGENHKRKWKSILIVIVWRFDNFELENGYNVSLPAAVKQKIYQIFVLISKHSFHYHRSPAENSSPISTQNIQEISFKKYILN